MTLPVNFQAVAELMQSAASGNDYKALVCVMLDGGNDNANTIVPNVGTAYTDYQTARGSLALSQADLTYNPISPIGYAGPALSLHPNLAKLKALFDSGKCSVIANVGPLEQPITKAQWEQLSAPIPNKLMSHDAQAALWGGERADNNQQTGWVGRLLDLINPAFNSAKLASSALGFDQKDVITQGYITRSHVISETGAVPIQYFFGAEADQQGIPLNATMLSMMTAPGSNPLEIEHSKIAQQAVNSTSAINNAIANANVTTVFPTTNLGNQLKQVAKLIASRASLGHRRQVFVVRLKGFDLHSSLLTKHASALVELDNALKAFYDSTVALGVANRVTTFTTSEFGRALAKNTNTGSDHGWGSHHFVIGGGIEGKRLYGTFPQVKLGGANDAGNGSLIPTTSVDQYIATLCTWFGIPNKALELVVPNLSSFASSNLGFMGAVAEEVNLPHKVAAIRHASADKLGANSGTQAALGKFDWVLWGASRKNIAGFEANLANVKILKPSAKHSNYVIGNKLIGQVTAINSITRNGTTVTVNTADAFGVAKAPGSEIIVGGTVFIANSRTTAFNGSWVVLTKGATSFTFKATGSAIQATADTSGEALCCSAASPVYDHLVKLNANKGWFLWKVGTTGRRFASTPDAYELNLSQYTAVDGLGDRWPQYKAKDDSAQLFGQVDGLDWVFIDEYVDPKLDVLNNAQYPNQQNKVDYLQAGSSQLITDPSLLSAHRIGYADYAEAHRAVSAARAKSPNVKVIGSHDANLPNEYYESLNGAFLDITPKDQSSWLTAMSYFSGARERLLPPQELIFHASLSSTTSYARLRYYYCFAQLLDNVHFCAKAANDDDGTFFWDEYLQPLGEPIEAEVTSTRTGTIAYRKFKGGTVFVNTSHSASAQVDLTGWGLKRFNAANYGNQDPTTNNGQAVTLLTIPAWDGIILVY